LIWYCPNCDAAARTVDAKVPWHPCKGLAGLSVALLPQGTRAKIEAVERGDYIGREQVQYDGNGRPVMSVVTTRDEGTDCAVLAPVATARLED
jgi:hypothetical protein